MPEIHHQPLPVKHRSLGGGLGIRNCPPSTRGSQGHSQPPARAESPLSRRPVRVPAAQHQHLGARNSFSHPDVCSMGPKHLRDGAQGGPWARGHLGVRCLSVPPAVAAPSAQHRLAPSGLLRPRFPSGRKNTGSLWSSQLYQPNP